VVDRAGRAYVGNFGFDLNGGAAHRATNLALVHPDGRVEGASDDMMFPNGTVITPDGRTLIVGETFRAQLTAFDVGADGQLSNRRVWAPLERAVPDGICLDAEGAIWVASPVSKGVLRVREGGAVADRIEVEHQAYACMLGGADRRTLYVCTAATHDPAKTGTRSGRIEAVEGAVPGARLPHAGAAPALARSGARVCERPEPAPAEGMALVRVAWAGVCRTDLELCRGYLGFRGVLGHEFVGTVADGPAAWRGARVVGEINFACGRCAFCARGLGRHCPTRTVMGIAGADGAIAQHVAVPIATLP